MEQRRYRRLPTSMRLTARGAEIPFPQPLLNISMGGAHVLTARPLPVGTSQTFGLQLHHEAPLELKGRVVWSRLGAMGVAFEDSDPRLLAYVERLERDASRL